MYTKLFMDFIFIYTYHYYKTQFVLSIQFTSLSMPKAQNDHDNF